jgi:hypothetical protein
MFSAEEALDFLAKRTGLTDDAAAGAVAGELGHLPLALALAAALIARDNLGYDGYLDRMRALQTGEDPAAAERAVRLSLEAVPVGVCHRVMEFISVLSVARPGDPPRRRGGLPGGRQPPGEGRAGSAGQPIAVDQPGRPGHHRR